MPAVYLKLGDLEGETKDARFKGWIDVDSYMSPQGSPGAGGHGYSPVTEIIVTKLHDRTSPAVMQAASMGRQFDKAILVRPHMGEGVVGSAIIMEDVIISSLQFSGGAKGDVAPMESLTLNFRKMTMGTTSDYSAQYGPASPAGRAKQGTSGRTR